jgi:hypothetical protein
MLTTKRLFSDVSTPVRGPDAIRILCPPWRNGQGSTREPEATIFLTDSSSPSGTGAGWPKRHNTADTRRLHYCGSLRPVEPAEHIPREQRQVERLGAVRPLPHRQVERQVRFKSPYRQPLLGALLVLRADCDGKPTHEAASATGVDRPTRVLKIRVLFHSQALGFGETRGGNSCSFEGFVRRNCKILTLYFPVYKVP